MKNFTRTVIGAFLLALGTLAAETIDLSMPDAWAESGKFAWRDGTIVTTGRIALASKNNFRVDPSKKYTLSFAVKASKPKNWLLAGFQAFDAKGRMILSPNVNAVPGSMTATVEAAPKGATFMILKDASKWKRDGGLSIVAGAKADYSDLPNFNIVSTGIADVKKEGENWKVTLSKPLSVPVAAGTGVRLHLPGGALYTCGITYISNEWRKISGSIRGVLENKPGYGPVIWPAGTAFGRVLILVNWKNVENMTTEFEELKLEIE